MMCTRSLGKVIIYEHIMYSLGHSSSLQDLDSVEDPIQSAPPCSGGGLSQVLLLDWLLPPQLTGHELKPVHDPHSPLIGEQAPSLQATTEEADPKQGVPPLAGAGLSQTRLLVCCPLPHEAEQSPIVHEPQLPSTPGQAPLLQAKTSLSDPSQGAPPLAGAGLSHM